PVAAQRRPETLFVLAQRSARPKQDRDVSLFHRTRLTWALALNLLRQEVADVRGRRGDTRRPRFLPRDGEHRDGRNAAVRIPNPVPRFEGLAQIGVPFADHVEQGVLGVEQRQRRAARDTEGENWYSVLRREIAEQ